jgi:hypothetical protein
MAVTMMTERVRRTLRVVVKRQGKGWEYGMGRGKGWGKGIERGTQQRQESGSGRDTVK